MPHPPSTPNRRRASSGHDIFIPPASPQGMNFSPTRGAYSRKSSFHSIRSPNTPRPPSSHSRNGDYGFPNDFGGGGDSGNGLGNLADELAEAWDEDGELEGDPAELHGEIEALDGGQDPTSIAHHDQDKSTPTSLVNLPILQEKPNGSPHPTSRPKKRRKSTGSDYDSDADSTTSTISPSLEARLSAIEHLARHSTPSSSSSSSAIFTRVATALKDLPSQSSLETHATRLATAHTALTSHLTSQTRTLHLLSTSLVSPLLAPPSPATTAALLELLPPLHDLLPAPSPVNLHALTSSTTDLLATLAALADSLHVARVTTTAAGRKLRGCREVVRRLVREGEEGEAGRRWVESGGWEERLGGREAARVCGEVVGGFEAVCEGWRRRLVEGLEIKAA